MFKHRPLIALMAAASALLLLVGLEYGPKLRFAGAVTREASKNAPLNQLLAGVGQAAAGVGVAYLPQFVVQECLSRGALERVLPEFSLPPGLLHAVFPSRRGMVPAVRALIDALAEGLRETGLN